MMISAVVEIKLLQTVTANRQSSSLSALEIDFYVDKSKQKLKEVGHKITVTNSIDYNSVTPTFPVFYAFI